MGLIPPMAPHGLDGLHPVAWCPWRPLGPCVGQIGGFAMGKRVLVPSALLALLATLLLAQPAGAQEEDPCANPLEGAILGTAGNDVLRGTPGPDFLYTVARAYALAAAAAVPPG